MNAQQNNPFRLDGKVALITGGAQGIGACIAEVFAAAGADVFVTDIDGQGASATTERIRAAGGRADSMAHDVGDEAQWQSAIDTTIARLGRLDVLVNNAGIDLWKLLVDTSLAEFQRVEKVNVEGAFLGMKHAILAMRPDGAAGQGGSIINMSSCAGIHPPAGLGAYSGSKGSVRLLTKAAAIEAGNFGIRVNSIHPGVIDTKMGREALDSINKLFSMDLSALKVRDNKPRLFGMGEAKDVAYGALYLAGDASRWVTGTELVIDGGSLIR